MPFDGRVDRSDVGGCGDGDVVEFVIARNPDPASSLPFLIRLPLGPNGIALKVRETWPRTSKVYCHRADDWPDELEVIERVPVRSCVRRGAAVDLVLDPALQDIRQLERKPQLQVSLQQLQQGYLLDQVIELPPINGLFLLAPLHRLVVSDVIGRLLRSLPGVTTPIPRHERSCATLGEGGRGRAGTGFSLRRRSTTALPLASAKVHANDRTIVRRWRADGIEGMRVFARMRRGLHRTALWAAVWRNFSHSASPSSRPRQTAACAPHQGPHAPAGR